MKIDWPVIVLKSYFSMFTFSPKKTFELEQIFSSLTSSDWIKYIYTKTLLRLSFQLIIESNIRIKRRRIFHCWYKAWDPRLMMRDQIGGNKTPFLRCFTKPCHAVGDCGGGAVLTLQNPWEKRSLHYRTGSLHYRTGSLHYRGLYITEPFSKAGWWRWRSPTAWGNN